MKRLALLTVTAAFFAYSCGNKLLKEAEKHYNNYEFGAAASLYENLLKTESSSVAMLHLADCYRQMNKNTEAEKWYAKAISSKDAQPQDKLHYAQVLKAEGKYQEAAAAYDEYLALVPADAVASRQRQSCDSTSTMKGVSPFYVVEPANFPGNGSCFSPFVYGHEVLYTCESELKPGQRGSNWTGRGYLDLFVLDESGNTHPLPGDVNSPLHEGPAVISAQGTELFFTRNRMVADKKQKSSSPSMADDRDNHLELCEAELKDGKWVNIRSLPFNSTEYSCGHPAITPSGTRLFFVSDMPGGKGGTDIYYSDFVNGSWSTPVNAGDAVNTSGNEMFPTIRMVIPGKNELYFSSDGFAGAGGLDIFKAEMSNDLPSNPERMAWPFNTASDDFGLVFQDGRSGYFSSNRDNAEGLDHIYKFTRIDPKFFVKAEVHTKGTTDPVPGTSVLVFNSKNNKTETMIADANGDIFFPADSVTNYSFTIRKEGYFTAFGAVNTGGFHNQLMDTSSVILEMEKIVINKPIRLDNIYYDYNKWNIRPDAAIELDKLVKIMNDNPNIKIELSSHTDCRGSDKYNMTLSQKRAQSAVDYIVSKGISRDRITAKGYGESVPLNKCVNGVKCTEEEYQWNRRTEFKVTQIVQQQ